MKTLHEIIEILGEHKDELRNKYRIKKIRIFGSYARGEPSESSDLDIIVDFEEPPTLIELMKIQEELERLLGVSVDLLTEESISPYIKPYIRKVVTV